MASKMHLHFFLFLLLFLYPQLSFSQNFELRQRFYYKIEKDGKLIGFSEEQLTPVKELPALEVKVNYKTVIKSGKPKLDFVKDETYLVDMTYDKMLSGKISYHHPGKKEKFELDINFRHYNMTRRVGRKANTTSLPRNALLENHRFFSVAIENKVAESVLGGELPFIWSDSGKLEMAVWTRLADTTLIVNGIRLICHHFRIAKKGRKPEYELWTLTNSGRLIRLDQFSTGFKFELADERYKNSFMFPYDLTKSRLSPDHLILLFSAHSPAKNIRIESKSINLTVDSMNTYPLDEMKIHSMGRYLKSVDKLYGLDVDDLYKVSFRLTRTRKHLDDILAAFTRWTNQQTKLNRVIKKEINQWRENEFDIARRSLILFLELCRASDIPARLIRGVYCLSPVESICYNWIWIEVYDGANWFPWHIFNQNNPLGDAAFINLGTTDCQKLISFKFNKIKNATVESYHFKAPRSLFR